MNWFSATEGGNSGDSQQFSADDAWRAYRELYPAAPHQQERGPLITDYPLHMSPMEIRKAFSVRSDDLILGLEYDHEGNVAPSVLPLLRGNSLLLSSDTTAYENGPLLFTVLRSLLRTHRNQCEVFGYGDMKRYYPGRELELNNNFMYPDSRHQSLSMFFQKICEAVGKAKIPIIYMDLLNRTEYRWGTALLPLPKEHASAFDEFFTEMGNQLLLIGSIGTDHTDLTGNLVKHYQKVLVRNTNDTYRSPYNLSYWDPERSLFVQAAANGYVEAYQSYQSTFLDIIAGSQFNERKVRYDD